MIFLNEALFIVGTAAIILSIFCVVNSSVYKVVKVATILALCASVGLSYWAFGLTVGLPKFVDELPKGVMPVLARSYRAEDGTAQMFVMATDRMAYVLPYSRKEERRLSEAMAARELTLAEDRQKHNVPRRDLPPK